MSMRHTIFSLFFLCSLLYGAEDPSIAGMVLDSPFSNLFTLMMELVDVYKIRLPKFTVSITLDTTWLLKSLQVCLYGTLNLIQVNIWGMLGLVN